MGEETSELRNKEVSELLDYAYATYKLKTILKHEDIIKKEIIYSILEKEVELVPKYDVTILSKKIDGDKEYTYNIKIDKIKAPLKVGDEIGSVEVIDSNNIIKKVPITVNKDISKANLFKLYLRNLKEIISV